MREWLSWWSTTLPRSGSRVRVPSRALLIYKRYPKRIPFVYKRVLPDSNGSRSPLCSGRCRTDIHRMSCTVSRSIRKRLEPIYICKSPAGLERFEVSALLRSVQNRHPPDVVHRLALNQKEVRTDIYMQESCRTRTVRIFVPLRSVQDCVFLVL